tara:strand:- start:1417 stop:2184 length:768 start_codon:yes stop_codon:yes gene_type:complete
MSKNLIKEKTFYKKNGYLIFNINNDILIDKVNADVKKLIKNKKYKTNTKIYSYNKSPRIVESFKLSKNCKKLAKLKIIYEKIRFLYDDIPKPFSTINFLKSTQQPLHSDYTHFGTIPKLKIVGSWIALQNIDMRSGPLQVVPGSHKMKVYNFFDKKKNIPTSLHEIKKNYTKYEIWIKKEIKEKKLKSITPQMKKGDCILWAANLLHGSPKCLNNKISRKSQVTHWSFKSVRNHYTPNFSIPKKSFYKLRKVKYF